MSLVAQNRRRKRTKGVRNRARIKLLQTNDSPGCCFMSNHDDWEAIGWSVVKMFICEAV